jgi:lysophospholipase L1-like esterase
MIYQGLELHGVVELEPAAGGGVLLRRFPAAVRERLSPLGRIVAQESAGCELRFVTEAESVRVAVSSLPSPLAPHELHNQDLFVFKGPFFHSHLRLEPGRVNHLHLTDLGGATRQAFLSLKPEVRDTDYFAHHVWRLMFGRYAAVFHELDTYGYPVRPPTAAEVPGRRLLCYGSSITNGASPTLYHLCYVQQAARALRLDVCNLGLSGSCLCEPELADYLAARDDWALLTLELGVNMRGGFTPEQFAARSRYLVERLIARHPARPIVLITIFPNGQSVAAATVASETQRREVAFNQALRDLVAELRHPHLHLLEGTDLLTDFTGLTRDLIHPGDYGHTELGLRLAAALRGLLPAGPVAPPAPPEPPPPCP